MIEEAEIECPYCGEPITVMVDCSVEAQEYTEDCEVCCQPIVITARADAGRLSAVHARREND